MPEGLRKIADKADVILAEYAFTVAGNYVRAFNPSADVQTLIRENYPHHVRNVVTEEQPGLLRRVRQVITDGFNSVRHHFANSARSIQMMYGVGRKVHVKGVETEGQTHDTRARVRLLP